MKHTLITLLTTLLLAMMLFCACSDETSGNKEGTAAIDVTVAVVLPMEGVQGQHWRQTLEMCSGNVKRATAAAGHEVNIGFEWYDELNSDITQLGSELAERSDITAVIGGLYSSRAKLLANRLHRKDKPLFTLATTEQFVRGYSNWGNLWAMTETDITQCEVLLSKAKMYGAHSVALIAREGDAYCQTFIDWFGFIAEELGIESGGIFTYTGNLQQDMHKALSCDADYLICVPADIDDLDSMLQAKQDAALSKMPRLLFSDMAYGANVLEQLGKKCEGIEGVGYGADPATGFEVSYEVYFGQQPTNGVGQIYDACMLIGFAVFVQQLYPDYSFREAMQHLVNGRDQSMGSWMEEDMTLRAKALAAGGWPDMYGASSNLDFDSKVYTNVLATIYYDFIICQNRYVIVDYNSTGGTKRSDATLAGWTWKAQQMKDFDDDPSSGTDRDPAYPPLHDRWALLVATSSTWANYRHQADVLHMYQILKSHGYDDDHILLIAEDDLAYNDENPFPGKIYSRPNSNDVYTDVHIDYHTSQLTPGDITDLLLGNTSDRLPVVLHPDADDNVLIFWSGHGSRAGMSWLDDPAGFSADDADAMLTQLEEAHAYRKLLWLAETCYSGGVCHIADRHSGVLAITAANAKETSLSDIYDMEHDIWMSNRFTSTLHDCIQQNSDISLRDLYMRLFINTVASHVCVFGAEGYGNLYLNGMGEYL